MRRSIAMVLALVVVLSLGLALVAGCAPKAPAEKPADFFKGKTISLYTGQAGSSADAFSRALATWLQKETGASVVVENQPGGGGGIETINLAYKAKPDGLTVLVYETLAVVLPKWLGQAGAAWDLAKFNWLARGGFQPAVFAVAPQKPYKTITDLQQAKGLKLAATTAGTFFGIGNALVAWALNLDAKVILGFKGGTDIRLAIQKGEVDGGVLTEDGAAAGDKAGQMRALFALYGGSALLPNIPALNKAVKLTAEQESMLANLSASSKVIGVAPDVPKDRVEFLAKALDNIANDKNARDDILKKTSIAEWYGYASRDEVQKYMSDPNTSALGKQLSDLFAKYHQ